MHKDKPEFFSSKDTIRGTAQATGILDSVYRDPLVAAGEIDAFNRILTLADTQTPPNRKILKLMAYCQAFFEANYELSDTKRCGRSRALELKQDIIFPFNESLKSVLNSPSSPTPEYLVGFMSATYKVMNDKEDVSNGLDLEHVKRRALRAVVGMRAELNTEQILFGFENVDIEYLDDNSDEERRDFDNKGVDYKIAVTILDKQFILYVDVKSSREHTEDNAGNPIKGRLWSQCERDDFYADHTVLLTEGQIVKKLTQMSNALIAQIRLQHPGKLESLCARKRVKIEDLVIT